MDKSILIVSAVFPPEQVTSAFLNYDLAKALSHDYKVIVLRPRPTRPIGAHFPLVWQDPNFETVMLDSYTYPESKIIGRFREAVDFSRKSVKYIKRHHKEIDFVYNDGWQLFGLYIIARACVKYNIPYIVPIQDIYPECLLTKGNYPGIVKRIINTILLPFDKYYQKNAQKVRTISEEMADYLSKTRRIDRNHYQVVNNWQNDEDFMKLPTKTNNDHIVFAYVGSVNVHANVDLMIRAFASAEIPSSEFIIYGGGSQKENCQQLVKELGLSNVSFGVVPRNEIPRIQAEADVLVLALPTGNGNLCLPSKLTSYLLSGRPVIASVDLDSSTSRLLERNKCGITVPPDDLEMLAQAFREFGKKSVEQREAMGENSRKYAMNHLTRSMNLKKVVESINDILR